ncbi:uncharacterized protein K02A2.6-like [Panicum virgatum]|uniref:uncharacterized protein K02A2.6-like n=1 Tax=Panicum virgatum TaxID=38727 RepID=UPI0019D59FBB|nr:uncharacterized protein K02A2.6-like [Panicum virgatum]
MGFTEQALKKSQYPLIGFGGKRIEALGKIELNVTFGEGVKQRTEAITFDVVDINYPYNAIFGHNILVKFAAVIHQPYLCMKIPSAGGVVTVYGNQEEARRCEDNAYSTNKTVHTIEATGEDTRTFVAEDMRRDHKNEGVSPAEHTKKVPLCEDVPDRLVIIGKELEEHEQIFMNKGDEEKTSFTTPFGTYCYNRMPEGLRNAGCTFNRMIKKVLGEQLYRNISAYVDDVVVRSKKKEDHIQDLHETFANLRRHGLKLNPEKCVFGVRRGKLLGCMITERGIGANPEKIEAISRMKPPTTKKGVQKLIGRLASLNRFISRLAEKSFPFFKALKGAANM